MVRSIRSLDDLARKGLDLNLRCRRCQRHQTFAIGPIRQLFRERGWGEGWPALARHFRCSGCGSKDIEPRAFLAAPDGVLDVLRGARRAALDRRIDTPEVRAALQALTFNRSDHAPIHAFWWAAGDGEGYSPARSQSVEIAARGILAMFFLED